MTVEELIEALSDHDDSRVVKVRFNGKEYPVDRVEVEEGPEDGQSRPVIILG